MQKNIIKQEKWRDKYGAIDYSETPHSVIKRKCGEFVRATKEKNIMKLNYTYSTMQ